MKVLTRLWLVAGASITAATVVYGAVTYSLIHKVGAERVQAQQAVHSVEQLKGVELAFLQEVQALQGVLLAPEEQRAVAVKQHETARIHVGELLGHLQLDALPEKTKGLVGRFMDGMSPFYVASDDLITLAGQPGVSRRAVVGQMHDKLDPPLAALKVMAGELDAQAVQIDAVAKARIDRALTMALLQLGGVCLAALVMLSMLTALWLRRSLVLPVLSVADQVSSLAQSGDLSQRLALDVSGELGSLQQAFNGFLAETERVVTEVSAAAKQAASTSQSLSGTTGYAVVTMQAVIGATDQLSQGATQQAGMTSSASEQMTHMAELAMAVTASVTQANGVSGQAESLAVAGRDLLGAAQLRIRNLQATVSHLEAIVQRLGERGERISAVVDMIKAIASQTNLLALNAAIEAARAGEQGRGFTVVAEEVRKLAGESARSAEEITAMVAEIQVDTRPAVEAMAKGRADADQGAAVIGEAVSSIHAIGAATHATDREVTAIAAAARDLQDCLRQTAHDLEAISAVTEEALAGTEEVHASANEQLDSIERVADAALDLAAMAEAIEQAISRFTISSAVGAAPVSAPALAAGLPARRLGETLPAVAGTRS